MDEEEKQLWISKQLEKRPNDLLQIIYEADMLLPHLISKEKDRCRIPYPHDFPDYRCWKCSPMTKTEMAIKFFGLLLLIISVIILLK